MGSDMPAPPASRPPLQYRVRALQLVTIGLALGVWETAARAGWIDPLFVPAPGAVGAALGTIGGTALAALGDTLGRTAIAYLLSVTLRGAAGGVGALGCRGAAGWRRVLPARRARRRDVRGGAGDGLRHELACQRLPGARALRRDRARLGGLDRDRAGPRPRQRAPLALAGLSAGRRPPASSLVPASPPAPRGSAPPAQGVPC